jgi:hypothetical protein
MVQIFHLCLSNADTRAVLLIRTFLLDSNPEFSPTEKDPDLDPSLVIYRDPLRFKKSVFNSFCKKHFLPLSAVAGKSNSRVTYPKF